jgi:hypothetical protein
MIPPLSYILIPAVASFLGAILGGLLTTYLNPRFQHRFWKRQQREEMRFKVANEVNRLIAEYGVNYLVGDMLGQASRLEAPFFQSWIDIAGKVKALFSDPTYQEFDKLYLTVITAPLYTGQEISDRSQRFTEFNKKRDAVLRVFYQEIGIL